MEIHKLCISYWWLRRWNDRWNNNQGRIQFNQEPVFIRVFESLNKTEHKLSPKKLLLDPLHPDILNRYTYSCWKSYSRLVKQTHKLVVLLQFRFRTSNVVSNNALVNIIRISWCYKSTDSSFSKLRQYTYDPDFLCDCSGYSSCTDCRSRIEWSDLVFRPYCIQFKTKT